MGSPLYEAAKVLLNMIFLVAVIGIIPIWASKWVPWPLVVGAEGFIVVSLIKIFGKTPQ